MDAFSVSSVGGRVKTRRILKQVEQHHSAQKNNIEEKEVSCDSRKRRASEDKLQEKGSGEEVKSGEKRGGSKRRTRISRDKKKSGANKFLHHSTDEDDGIEILGDVNRNHAVIEIQESSNEDNDVEEKVGSRGKCAWGFQEKGGRKNVGSEGVSRGGSNKREGSGKRSKFGFYKSLDHSPDESSDSDDGIDMLGDCSRNHATKLIETQEGKDVEVLSEYSSEDTDDFEILQSNFAETNGVEDNTREEKRNFSFSSYSSELKRYSPTRAGMEVLELDLESSFDSSNEILISDDTETDGADDTNESLPSSDSEPDDSDDEDFDIRHYNSPDSEESLTSSEYGTDHVPVEQMHSLEKKGKRKVEDLHEGAKSTPLHEPFCRKERIIQASKALIDAMLERLEVLKEESSKQGVDEPCEPQGTHASSTDRTLPLKFRFEDEESEHNEKSEDEKMSEDLFAEMYNCILVDVNNDPTKGDSNIPDSCNLRENQIKSCHEGKHVLVKVEDLGEVCRFCGYVEREVKYMYPDFAKVQRSWGRKYDKDEHFSGFNFSDLKPSADNLEDSFNDTDGTVWKMIPGVKETMYPHQQEGFEFLWRTLEGTIDLAELKSSNSRNVGGCIISHAPVAGKTRLTIVFIDSYLKVFPNARPMIIAPASVLLTWEEEFTKWKSEFPFYSLNNLELSGKENKQLLENISVGRTSDKDVRLFNMYSWTQHKSILGVSYQLYERLVALKTTGMKKGEIKVVDQESENLRKVLLELPQLVILDEGHTPRNQASSIWKTLSKLHTGKKIILSGTPFQNNFKELFNVLDLVRPTTARTLAKEKAFAEMIPSSGRYRETGPSFSSSRKDEVEKLVEKLKATMAPFVHILKGSILQESLPGLRDCIIILNAPPQQKSLIEKNKVTGGKSNFEDDHRVALLSVHPSLLHHCLSHKENSSVDQETLTRLRKDPNAGAKTRFIFELIRLSRAMNEKVLIFSQFIQPLRLLKEQLMEHFVWEDGKQIFEMQGRVDQKQRQEFMKIFNDHKSEARVLLASTKCCSEGIHLVGASRIVLIDVVWNPSVERQAISRAYRIGQNKVVFTYHLMTYGTTEANKYCRKAAKDHLSELVFSSAGKENDKQKTPSLVCDDRILEEMLAKASMKDMFQRIIYQPRKADLVGTFGSASFP